MPNDTDEQPLLEGISSRWLADHHIGTSDEERDSLADIIYDELALRSGELIITHFTDEQVAEYGQLVDEGTEDEQSAYLEKVYPHYRDSVVKAIEDIKQDLLKSTDPIALIKSFKHTDGQSATA